MATWPGGIAAITSVRRGASCATKRFYQEVFGLPVVFEDENSAVFRFGETVINLLDVAPGAGACSSPRPLPPPTPACEFQFTIGVEDVDAMCEELQRRGVELLNGPHRPPVGHSDRELPRPRPATSGRSPHDSSATVVRRPEDVTSLSR